MTRSCDGCTLCCDLVSVFEIGKHEFTACPECIMGTGCARQNDKPESCRDYACAWLLGHGTEADRPDEVGYVISQCGFLDMRDILTIHESRTDASKGPVRDVWIAEASRQSRALWIIPRDGHSTFILPHDVELSGQARQALLEYGNVTLRRSVRVTP